jgi:hypothetical protein
MPVSVFHMSAHGWMSYLKVMQPDLGIGTLGGTGRLGSIGS